ncbi:MULTISPECIES: GNAT family protein [unclassified Pseudodesulfovibrio]|uniref:GNAT family N-acetyltransferase n=1 Tax=unclassified Pseudodesulfovibrio TaxID=2661612 RepID=UPI000FEB5F94|nr:MULTISPECIES: GNAT family protein [unclassified Pseudodesulfovibrio]MCJ2165790.1 GNAT family N-acetyltransferase [Pseudodesulfovibrio sp. S3-i]RWU02773.1 N-acetyltransferase [Pseudodesulfovibrio sp. S3]
MQDFSRTILRTARCVLRPWRGSDAPSLPPIADTKAISWNTSYRFPYPYDEAAAKKFLDYHTANPGEDAWLFAILRDQQLIGGCGCERGKDIQSHTAIMGYWLGVDHWGKGIATEVVTALTAYMGQATNVEKLSATVFGWNPASRRVLEKCGFVNEGVSKDGVRKWGKTTDLWYYGRPLP